ncbi:hypothetical protein D9M71_121540 [compost metagenome]
MEQAEALAQGMNGPQHGAGHIVGIDLVATHHQQRRSLFGGVGRGEQAVEAQQALRCRVMRLAAGTVENLVEACAQDEVGWPRCVVQQVWRPLGHAFVFTSVTFDQKVVVDLHIARQRRLQRQVDQVHEGVSADGDDMAVLPCQRVVNGAPVGVLIGEGQAQGQWQGAGTDQPQHQALWFQAA